MTESIILWFVLLLCLPFYLELTGVWFKELQHMEVIKDSKTYSRTMGRSLLIKMQLSHILWVRYYRRWMLHVFFLSSKWSRLELAFRNGSSWPLHIGSPTLSSWRARYSNNSKPRGTFGWKSLRNHVCVLQAWLHAHVWQLVSVLYKSFAMGGQYTFALHSSVHACGSSVWMAVLWVR